YAAILFRLRAIHEEAIISEKDLKVEICAIGELRPQLRFYCLTRSNQNVLLSDRFGAEISNVHLAEFVRSARRGCQRVCIECRRSCSIELRSLAFAADMLGKPCRKGLMHGLPMQMPWQEVFFLSQLNHLGRR